MLGQKSQRLSEEEVAAQDILAVGGVVCWGLEKGRGYTVLGITDVRVRSQVCFRPKEKI